MSAERCATCVHYKPGTSGVGGHHADIPGHLAGECSLAVSHSGEPDRPASLAVSFDHEEYEARLAVSPGFGCIQWAAAKDGEPTS